eukprot:863922-Pelagomonas_calceolata.AAC.1
MPACMPTGGPAPDGGADGAFPICQALRRCATLPAAGARRLCASADGPGGWVTWPWLMCVFGFLDLVSGSDGCG